MTEQKMKEESKIRKIINSLAANEEIVVVNLYQEGFLLRNMPKEGPFAHVNFFDSKNRSDDIYNQERPKDDRTTNIGDILSDSREKNDHQIDIEVAPKRNFVYAPEKLWSFLNELVPDLKPESHHNQYGENIFGIRKNNLQLGKLLYTEEIGEKSVDFLVKIATDDPELKSLDCFDDSKQIRKEKAMSFQRQAELFRYTHLALYPDPLVARICSFSYNLELEQLKEHEKLICKRNKTEKELISGLVEIWGKRYPHFRSFAESKCIEDMKTFEKRFGPYIKLVMDK